MADALRVIWTDAFWLLLPTCIPALPLLLVALSSWRWYLGIAGALTVLLLGAVMLATWQMRQPDVDDSAGAGFGLMMLVCADLVAAPASITVALLAALIRCLRRLHGAHPVAVPVADAADGASPR